MKRSEFLKASVAVAFAPWLAKVPAAKAAPVVTGAAPAVVPALANTITIGGGYGNYVRIGDIVRVTSTGETMMVTAHSTGSTWAVKRGIGSVEPAPAHGELYCIAGTQAVGETIEPRLAWMDDKLLPRVGMVVA